MLRFSVTVILLVLLSSAFEIRRFTEGAKMAKPRQSSPRKMEKLQATDTAKTCKDILEKKPHAPSGTYTVKANSGDLISIYCEMGLNFGGYTFLSSMSLISLTDAEIQAMFTDRTTLLLRVQKTDGTQPYAVLSQRTSLLYLIPLRMNLNSHAGYNPPINKRDGTLEPPFLFFGFIPFGICTADERSGAIVNGKAIRFANCNESQNNQFTLYTNFKEAQPSAYVDPKKVCDPLFAQLLPNPSGREMPSEFFFFGETAWGGCGGYVQTNQFADIIGFAIGFR